MGSNPLSLLARSEQTGFPTGSSQWASLSLMYAAPCASPGLSMLVVKETTSALLESQKAVLLSPPLMTYHLVWHLCWIQLIQCN